MGEGVNTMQILIVIVAITMLGVLVWGVNVMKAPATITGDIPLTEDGLGEAGTGVVSCPSDGTTDAQVRYKDSLASITTYLAPTVYFMPETLGNERVTAGALSTSDYSTAVDLKCTESGTKWKAIAVAGSEASHSVEGEAVFVAEGAFVKRELIGKAFGNLKFKVEDKFTGGSKFFNVTTCTASTQVGVWTVFNGTQCVVANGAGGDTGTSLTLGTDGYMDMRIYLKTNATKQQFGEDGLRTWMLVDASAAEFDEPVAYRAGGATLIDDLASMADEDRRKYSGYEYAYNIGSFGDREDYVDFYMQSAAGVNPSTDPVVDFCSETRYNSAKQGDTILVGCWNDAATQVQQSTARIQQFKIDIT